MFTANISWVKLVKQLSIFSPAVIDSVELLIIVTGEVLLICNVYVSASVTTVCSEGLQLGLVPVVVVDCVTLGVLISPPWVMVNKSVIVPVPGPL